MENHAFTTKQLAELGLPGLPASAEGWRGIALAEGWKYNEYPGRGRGGVRRKFIPPPGLLDVIHRKIRGEQVTKEEIEAVRARSGGGQSSEQSAFTCAELAAMKLPGGLSERGWLKAATRYRWEFVEIPAKGGKGGVKKVFSPPAELLKLIHCHVRGEPVKADEVDSAKSIQGAARDSQLQTRDHDESSEPGHFSCLELAQMRIPGFPTTEQGWGKVVSRGEWPWVEVQAKGGKKGVKRVFTPPSGLLEVIHRHSRGEAVTEATVAAARASASHPRQREQSGRVDLRNYSPLGYYNDISLSANHEGDAPDALLFSKTWLQAMGFQPDQLLLVRVKGDSMHPTLHHGSTVMIDMTATKVTSGIYAIDQGGTAIVKRLQALLGGVIRVMSDNPAYDAFEIDNIAAESKGFSVIGRVVWHAGAVP